MVKIWMVHIFLFCGVLTYAQESSFTQSAVNKKRQWLVGSASVALYGGSLLSLNQAWYDQYDRTSFHTFNDSKEWLQVDKVGHAWSAYNLSRASTAVWKWAGLKDKKAVLVGSVSGFGYLTVIELLDARSSRWGWSWADMSANLFGSALFAGQDLAWKEQRIQFKFSAHKKTYDASLQNRVTELYGKSLPERLLKDYNSQTYWLSFSASSFLKKSNLPAWLNISIGYGADGLFGGFENKAMDKDGLVTFDRRDIKRYRQWYLAPDIDLTKIKTNSKFLKASFSVLNAFKIPAPAIQLANGNLRARAIVF
jgi:uncharacterized protein YfiM (DUF2279 family)